VAGVQDVEWTGEGFPINRMHRDCRTAERSRVQFRARSWGGTNDPVTRSRLAIQIARRVIEFLEVGSALLSRAARSSFVDPSKAMEDVESTDLAWKVGRGHITARDLVLVSLAQVSKGSWQPLLRLLV